MRTPFAPQTTAAATAVKAPSEKQVNYCAALMRSAALAASPADLAAAEQAIQSWVTKPGREAQTVSDSIKRLLDAGHNPTWNPLGVPVVTDAALPGADVVPAGRYALPTNDEAINELAFYKVDRPTEGRWAGRVFVKLFSSDTEVRLSWSTSKSVLARIAEMGAEESSKLYGREIGECGVCGRTLTNDTSRELGIGPKCRELF